MDGNSTVILGCCLSGIVIFLLTYIGVFHKVKVSVGKPVANNATIAYKPHTGAYKNSLPHFKEAYTLCPKLKCIGIFYDDPRTTPEAECRYIIGLILAENGKRPDGGVLKLVEDHKFNIIKFPSVEHVVKAQFPFRANICAAVGTWKVYPALNAFTTEKKLDAFPYLEIYDEKVIHYIAPLSKHEEFFVPEVDFKCSTD